MGWIRARGPQGCQLRRAARLARDVVPTQVGVHPREFQYPGYGCPADGWLYFIVAGLNIDRSQLWLEYMAGTERGDLAFWTLTERPAAGEPRGGR